MAGNENDLSVATLAAALIRTRGITTVKDAAVVVVDARNLLFPETAKADYKAWQVTNGLTPTSPAEDQQRQREQAAWNAWEARKAIR